MLIEDIKEITLELRGPRGETGPAGPAGPVGPAGKPGDPGQMTESQLRSIVASVSASLMADGSLRGPQGERGPAGASAAVDYDTLAAEVIKRLLPTRIVIADRSRGKVLDDETYMSGEPIVLDFQNIIRAAEAR